MDCFFFKQQTMQVALLLYPMEEAYKKIDILEGALVEAQKIIEEKEGVEESSRRKTLVVMDSHVKNLNTRQIEEELGGLLFTGQFSCEFTTIIQLLKSSLLLGKTMSKMKTKRSQDSYQELRLRMTMTRERRR